jgi:putative transposase
MNVTSRMRRARLPNILRCRRPVPRRSRVTTRLTLVVLARFVEWRALLTILQPDTLVRWHRPCRSAVLALEVQTSRTPADSAGAPAADGRHGAGAPDLGRGANRSIAAEAGISLSPRTVRRDMRRPRAAHPGSHTQAWSTFVRNPARDVLACDFFVTVTARFRLLDGFVVLDVGPRRWRHGNVTAHPTAAWTVQPCRACVTGESGHHFVVHDHATISAPAVDRGVRAMGLRVLKTPLAAPHANAYGERLIGTAPSSASYSVSFRVPAASSRACRLTCILRWASMEMRTSADSWQSSALFGRESQRIRRRSHRFLQSCPPAQAGPH